MFENNIIFSLIISLTSTISFYLFTHRDKKTLNDNHKQEMIMLFGVSFATSFLIKCFSEKMSVKEIDKAIESSVITHSTRPPF